MVVESDEAELTSLHGSTLRKVYAMRNDLAGRFYKHIAAGMRQRLARLES